MLTPSSPLIDTPNILAQVADCRGQCPPSPQVVQALLDSERAAKHPRPALPIDALLGQWRLRFTAPNKPAYKAREPVGKGFYWPRLFPGSITFSRATPPAEIASDGPMPAPPPSALPEPEEAQPQALQSDALSIENQLQFGPLALRFSGPAKFFTKQNLLAFDFVQVQLFLGRFCLLKLPIKGQVGTENFAQTPIAKLPFFAFFAATDQYLAARGRGGGLALWAK